MILLKPTYLALDTSHLTQWQRDKSSTDAVARRHSEEFSSWLEDSGTIPMVTLHHLEELCAIDDEVLVRSRLRFLHALPLVAWIATSSVQGDIGGITSILGAEALSAYHNPGDDLATLRSRVTSSIIRVGTGEDMLGSDPDVWLALRKLFLARSHKARSHVAITHSTAVDLRSKPMSELLGGRIRSKVSMSRQLDVIRGSLAMDIRKYGDGRISDPNDIAGGFMEKVADEIEHLPLKAADLVWQSLAYFEIEPSDVDVTATLGEVLDHGQFLKQMKICTEGMGIPFPELKRSVKMDRLPSWIISSNLRKHAATLNERKGSELNDGYLACLAPYADVTMVDKRTFESFRQAKRANPRMAAICNRIERAPTYRVIPKLI
ncbi:MULTISPECIES: hypothetical protein [Rhizobium]|uniref:Uncharacterized protein n=1 Tax=Rhizobium rhododendri TaxID=2506430 RepID=A0ABY8IJI6_9HYPH|nr:MULTISPECIES: hypothetical protein [Rhizobium]MBZ5759981.1 hypothetical protein [Rhizobium sp. VS19-DR96]MBZ5766538.1 hypothetical protein [Rhizobium sp. VS19-DR129.2]MBZ5774119.1 hypothetical protein [Rhizobium sp. VS19-DRK62.2]MBZ5785191.1 hypothetical protein [Rhizobium sp. VS19-DR121]MBZ5802790.1 hypothetical protein [Rhizobium sp. VS19-DR181]